MKSIATAVLLFLIISCGMAQENNAAILLRLNEISLHKKIRTYFPLEFPMPPTSPHHVVFYTEPGKFSEIVSTSYNNNFALLVNPDDLFFYNITEYFRIDSICTTETECVIIFSAVGNNNVEKFSAKFKTNMIKTWKLIKSDN